MVSKKLSTKANRHGAWEPPSTSAKNGLKAIRELVNSKNEQTRAMHARVAERNGKMADATAREFAKAGIDFKKLEAIGVATSIQTQEEMKKYRKRTSPRPGPGGLLPLQNVAAVQRNATNSITVCTPPFINDAWVNPPNPGPGVGAFANSNANGRMEYFMDVPMTSHTPADIVTVAVNGIMLVPILGSTLPPVLGFAGVQMSAGLQMSGHATANFFGYAHSEGSVGWIVEEFDMYGNFTRFVETTYQEQYYIDVNGRTDSVQVENENYSSSTLFLTYPERFYQVYVWFWGNTHAAGNQGPWASQAAGFGKIGVQSISWIWSPLWWL
jgi:hypothetical protein